MEVLCANISQHMQQDRIVDMLIEVKAFEERLRRIRCREGAKGGKAECDVMVRSA